MALWNLLVDHGQVAKVRGGESSGEYLAEYARPLLQYVDVAEAVSFSGRPSAAEGPSEVSNEGAATLDAESYEFRRARALAEYVALLAAMYRPVRRLREMIQPLGVSYAEIEDLLGSPESYEEILAHGDAPEMAYVISELGKELSEELNGYWSDREAISFVLADNVSVRPPVSVGLDDFAEGPLGYGVITMRVEPWVHADTVLSLYKEQQRLYEGRRPRVFSSRNLEVAQFVFTRLRMMWYVEMSRMVERLRSDERTGACWYESRIRRSEIDDLRQHSASFSWRNLMESWNSTHAAERYDDERRFYQDFYRTARVIVGSFRFSRGTWFAEDI
jgi:hypothetical protein